MLLALSAQSCASESTSAESMDVNSGNGADAGTQSSQGSPPGTDPSAKGPGDAPDAGASGTGVLDSVTGELPLNNNSGTSTGGNSSSSQTVAPSTDAGTPKTSKQPPTSSGSELALPYRYASSAIDTRLVFEVDSVPEKQPRQTSTERLAERFGKLLDKPDGVSVKLDGTVESRGGSHAWTFDELKELAPTLFDNNEPEGTVSIHVMFLDGSYDSGGDGVVLGVAWANRYIAMFTDVINNSCSSSSALPSLSEDACRAAEFGVWSHEVGHVLGLVNNGLPMMQPHQDEAHGAHDNQEGCLMYWAYDGPSFVDTTLTRLGAGQPEIDFCEQSLADLAAARQM